jgi:hypothetical protein
MSGILAKCDKMKKAKASPRDNAVGVDCRPQLIMGAAWQGASRSALQGPGCGHSAREGALCPKFFLLLLKWFRSRMWQLQAEREVAVRNISLIKFRYDKDIEGIAIQVIGRNVSSM